MKNYFFILFFSLGSIINSDAQRYLNETFPESEVTSDITYGSALNYQGIIEILKLDFYEPKGDQLDERPLIIYAHGGGFVDVNQTKSLTHIVAYCDSFARKGYAVASINYRLDEKISHRAIVNAMHDMKAAIRYFRKEKENYRIDTNLIFVGGESAGAITSLSASYINETSELNFAADLPLAEDNSLEGSSGNSGYSSAVTGAMCLCGGTMTTNNELLFDTLAMQSAADPPLLQIHGTNDLLISTLSALNVSIRANNLSIPFLFYALEDATHCPWYFPLENSWEYLDTLIDLTVPFLYAFILETATEEINNQTDNIKVFPNPSSGEFHLEFNRTLQENLNAEIFDLGGHKLLQRDIRQ